MRFIAMERIRPAAAALSLAVYLFLTCVDHSEGSCGECTVYPYLDSPGNDIAKFTLSPAACADQCIRSTVTNQIAIAFVVNDGGECYCKSGLNGRFDAALRTTIVKMGNTSCRYLFEN